MIHGGHGSLVGRMNEHVVAMGCMQTASGLHA